MKNLADCGHAIEPDRREELKRIVDNLNEFYEEHGRTPSSREIGLLNDNPEQVKTKELIYEPIDGE